MITKEEVLTLHHGSILHSGECSKVIGPRGGERITQVCVRINGKVKTWKRSPERWEVPVSYGLYRHGYITDKSASYYHLPKDCPLNKEE